LILMQSMWFRVQDGATGLKSEALRCE